MDFSPSPCRPRTPTGVARRSGRLPPLRGLCLVPQRHLSPPSGRAGTAVGTTLAVQGLSGQRLAPAARRDLPATSTELPGTGVRPVRALCQFPGPVPPPGPARGAGADDRRRPGLRADPGGGGLGPTAVCRAHAAHRGTARPEYRRGRPDRPGPGPYCPSCDAWPGNDRRRTGPSCWRSGRR